LETNRISGQQTGGYGGLFGLAFNVTEILQHAAGSYTKYLSVEVSA
jgi:hypothetical protein